jgi:hypothetical protein
VINLGYSPRDAMLSNLGRQEEALEATTEAAEVYLRLAGDNPGAFEPGFARALSNLGSWL